MQMIGMLSECMDVRFVTLWSSLWILLSRYISFKNNANKSLAFPTKIK